MNVDTTPIETGLMPFVKMNKKVGKYIWLLYLMHKITYVNTVVGTSTSNFPYNS